MHETSRTRFWWNFGGVATHLEKIKILNIILITFESGIYL